MHILAFIAAKQQLLQQQNKCRNLGKNKRKAKTLSRKWNAWKNTPPHLILNLAFQKVNSEERESRALNNMVKDKIQSLHMLPIPNLVPLHKNLQNRSLQTLSVYLKFLPTYKELN